MAGFEQIVIETTRLRLRWLEPGDRADIFDLFSDPQAMRYWSTPPMAEIQQAQALITRAIEDYASGSGLRLALESRETSRVVGTCSLFSFQSGSRRAEIGYMLGRRYWGQGLMGEALNALVDYAFTTMDLNRLEADIDPRNSRSRHSLIKLGFSKEGLLRERWIVNGEVTDSEVYGLLSADWRSPDNKRI